MTIKTEYKFRKGAIDFKRYGDIAQKHGIMIGRTELEIRVEIHLSSFVLAQLCEDSLEYSSSFTDAEIGVLNRWVSRGYIVNVRDRFKLKSLNFYHFLTEVNLATHVDLSFVDAQWF